MYVCLLEDDPEKKAASQRFECDALLFLVCLDFTSTSVHLSSLFWFFLLFSFVWV